MKHSDHTRDLDLPDWKPAKLNSRQRDAIRAAATALGHAYFAVEAEFPGIEPSCILAGFGEGLAELLASADAAHRDNIVKTFLICLKADVQRCVRETSRRPS